VSPALPTLATSGRPRTLRVVDHSSITYLRAATETFLVWVVAKSPIKVTTSLIKLLIRWTLMSEPTTPVEIYCFFEKHGPSHFPMTVHRSPTEVMPRITMAVVRTPFLFQLFTSPMTHPNKTEFRNQKSTGFRVCKPQCRLLPSRSIARTFTTPWASFPMANIVQFHFF
jgi:hypothetical protein